MSILIKGMEMPTRCADCPMCYDYIRCRLLQESFGEFDCVEYRWECCPLIEVPKHGRLIDADALNDMINRSYPMTDRVDVHNGYAICQELIKSLPTIIESEVQDD